jgi:hypothetical protein
MIIILTIFFNYSKYQLFYNKFIIKCSYKIFIKIYIIFNISFKRRTYIFRYQYSMLEKKLNLYF